MLSMIFSGKVHIFWEGHKILRNLPLTFDCSTYSQKLGEDFVKFCGLFRIYELYVPLFLDSSTNHNILCSGSMTSCLINIFSVNSCLISVGKNDFCSGNSNSFRFWHLWSGLCFKGEKNSKSALFSSITPEPNNCLQIKFRMENLKTLDLLILWFYPHLLKNKSVHFSKKLWEY